MRWFLTFYSVDRSWNRWVLGFWFWLASWLKRQGCFGLIRSSYATTHAFRKWPHSLRSLPSLERNNVIFSFLSFPLLSFSRFFYFRFSDHLFSAYFLSFTWHFWDLSFLFFSFFFLMNVNRMVLASMHCYNLQGWFFFSPSRTRLLGFYPSLPWRRDLAVLIATSASRRLLSSWFPLEVKVEFVY